ncbi:MAG TPA: AAA family ATPase, partial [Gaiellaceae bacterium]|nr:AAA family ATPase [Gaiellaceae bacterium]
MEAAGDTIHPPLFRRHARRPRLTRLLDESTAQTILVTAPAGYGKTTLAMEWLQGRDDVVWYRATNASADVAAFSAGLADVVEPLVAHAGDRLRQRLRVADTPERAARPLAELLSEDLEGWPKHGFLVIDDYHLVTDSAPVEDFFDWLLMLAPPQLRVLVTTRRRPRWASARRILYGEITEIGRDQLAMNAEEAGRVLDDRPPESVEALVAQAEGWPALIGLAALSASREIPGERVLEALYRYFAEEVVRRERPEVERLMLLASIPIAIDPRGLHDVLGVDDPEPWVERLVADGLLQPSGSQFRFHPLLRT